MAVDLKEIIRQFRYDGRVSSVESYGNGHINDTYLVKAESGQKLILQRMNQNVFKKPVELMENIQNVTTYLR